MTIAPAAAPATEAAHVDDDLADIVFDDADRDLHALCERYIRWCESRRFYVRPSLPPNILGRLRSRGTGRSTSGGPDAVLDAELLAFHHAVIAQPEEALDRQVFEAYYRVRCASVKAAAALLGISRQHFYRVLSDFRHRVYRSSRAILAANLAAAGRLPSRAGQGMPCEGARP